MKSKMKKMISMILVLTSLFSFTLTVSAKESVGNGLLLTDDALTLTEGTSAVLTAAMQEGFDASRLACVSSNPEVVTVAPTTSMAHIANFQIDFVGYGSAVVAIYHMDNPEIVAYTTVNAAPVAMELPAKLGTNRDNYCTFVNAEFVPYEFHKYGDFNDYKCTMKLSYRCDSYKDKDFTKWGCYGYFYDEAGNLLSKVHLYSGALSKGRIYQSEFNVPVNAVRFAVEGFH